eukprot:1516242-Prymnesium_polylepis.1
MSTSQAAALYPRREAAADARESVYTFVTYSQYKYQTSRFDCTVPHVRLTSRVVYFSGNQV